MNKWWNQFKEEYYWVEVTRRDDIGENLKSPQKNKDQNKPYFPCS